MISSLPVRLHDAAFKLHGIEVVSVPKHPVASRIRDIGWRALRYSNRIRHSFEVAPPAMDFVAGAGSEHHAMDKMMSVFANLLKPSEVLRYQVKHGP